MDRWVRHSRNIHVQLRRASKTSAITPSVPGTPHLSRKYERNRQMTRLQRLTGLIVYGYLSWAAAARIIALRANDGSFPNPDPPFNGGTNPGDWRPTISYNPGPPPSLASMAAPWLGAVKPFTLVSSTQFRAQPPPALTSGRYTR